MSEIEDLEKMARALAEGASAETRDAIETIVREAKNSKIVRTKAQPVRFWTYLALSLCLAALIMLLLWTTIR